MVPESLDLQAMLISIEDAQFRTMYALLCQFQRKLILAHIEAIVKYLQARELHQEAIIVNGQDLACCS
jgi:hypothetical protein